VLVSETKNLSSIPDLVKSPAEPVANE